MAPDAGGIARPYRDVEACEWCGLLVLDQAAGVQSGHLPAGPGRCRITFFTAALLPYGEVDSDRLEELLSALRALLQRS